MDSAQAQPEQQTRGQDRGRGGGRGRGRSGWAARRGGGGNNARGISSPHQMMPQDQGLNNAMDQLRSNDQGFQVQPSYAPDREGRTNPFRNRPAQAGPPQTGHAQGRGHVRHGNYVSSTTSHVASGAQIPIRSTEPDSSGRNQPRNDGQRNAPGGNQPYSGSHQQHQHSRGRGNTRYRNRYTARAGNERNNLSRNQEFTQPPQKPSRGSAPIPVVSPNSFSRQPSRQPPTQPRLFHSGQSTQNSRAMDDSTNSRAMQNGPQGIAAKGHSSLVGKQVNSHAVGENPGTPFVPQQVDDDHWARLEALVIPPHVKEKQPFVTAPLSFEQLLAKRRCEKCKKVVRSVRQVEDYYDSEDEYSRAQAGPPPLLCKFHTGKVSNRHWDCCGAHVAANTPCSGHIDHITREYAKDELENKWQFFPTPVPDQIKAASSSRARAEGFRRAIAIDCEMGTSTAGDSELIRVTVVDYETRQTLMDKLVWPDAHMQHFNTRYSGVTRSQMERAFNKKQCLMGTTNAREEVWKFVSPDTLVIGHSVHNDLMSLRWIHDRIIDTYVLEERVSRDAEAKKAIAEQVMKDLEEAQKAVGVVSPETAEATSSKTEKAVDTGKSQNDEKKREESRRVGPKGAGPLSLKTAALVRLGRAIRVNSIGHDSLEDALASRDIAEWHAYNTGDDIPWQSYQNNKTKDQKKREKDYRRLARKRERGLGGGGYSG